jgi:hypothetical protein
VISTYRDTPGSQAEIDKCRLVLWAYKPYWLAGHDYCGFSWLADVRPGTTVRVTTGRAKGTYIAVKNTTINRRTGPMPSFNADLVLQACVPGGTGFTLLNRVKG